MSLSFNGVLHFSILVLLFMIVASLLGMEFFAYKVKDDDGLTPRVNFDNFFYGMIAVFVLLTNESWNTIMITNVKSMNSYLPVLYFSVVVIVGNFILLKLFLAILINNFADANKKVSELRKLQGESSNYLSFIKKSLFVLFICFNKIYN